MMSSDMMYLELTPSTRSNRRTVPEALNMKTEKEKYQASKFID
ncbi:hypothetical protein Hdeb2414_s0020g00557991 [Helianthus debilis subsp. tardiflorus]